jgi:hypothetical protein
MAKESLNEKLEQLHADVVEVMSARMQGELVSNDDIKTALALLKQNNITAPLGPAVPDADRAARLAGKLKFDGIKEKRGVVLPFSAPESTGDQSPRPPAPAESA